MSKHNYFVKFLKKIYLSINSLLKKNLNKLSIVNFSNITRSNKIFLTFTILIILSSIYLLIPNIYDKAKISKELKNQLKDRFSLEFDLSDNFKYNFSPRPHFTYKNSTILIDQNEIARMKELKIYVSLDSLFSLNNIKVNNLILKNSNFNLNNQTYNFFTKLLNQNFKGNSLTIKDSNIFFKNEDEEVLFINKVVNMKYYYDVKELKNIVISKNEIFNLPYSLEINKNKNDKKIFSKLNLNFLNFQIENEIYDNNNIKKGSATFILNQNKSNSNYELNKDNFIFHFFDKFKNPKFSYKVKINLNPFYSMLEGTTKEFNLFRLLDSNDLILQLLKTEILNSKNLNFDLNVQADKIKNYNSFTNLLLNSKILEGLIDIDNTKFHWKNNTAFEISDSLIYVKNNELILDGKLDLIIKDSDEIYKFLLTPKNYRTEIKRIDLSFNYNFDQKTLNLNNVKINNKINQNVNNNLKSLIFKNDKLQNKIYLKKFFNKAIKAYAG